MAKRIAERSSLSVSALLKPVSGSFHASSAAVTDAKRGGSERVALANQHAGECGHGQRRRCGDLGAFAGADRLEVQQNDEHADESQREQREGIAEHATGGAEHRHEGEGAEARFLLAALALDPDKEADRQRQRELKESRKVLPAGYVTGHSKRMYSTTGGGGSPPPPFRSS